MVADSALAAGAADVVAVIPGKNCARTLGACLASLSTLRAEGSLTDVVFVDDGCQDDSVAIARSHGARVLQSRGRGPGAARNTGWGAVDSRWIWFVDSDCVAEPDALAFLRERQRLEGARAVGGSYANACPESLTARLIHVEMVTRHRRIGSRSDFAITANLLCERALLAELAGFDEALKLAQDLDLAYRIVDSGAALGFEWRSRVAHFHESSFLAYLKKQARQGYWRMQLYRKHPRRMTGDRYSNWTDYAQPPLGLLALGLTGLAATAALGAGPIGFTSTVSGLAVLAWAGLLALELKIALQLEGATAGELAAYLGFGAARALARGAGMVAGALALASSRRP
jgi:GT2 family glycosyltransferase